METNSGMNRALWAGVIAGAAIGIGISIARRRRYSRVAVARRATRRVADFSSKLVSEEGRRLADEGRRLAEEGRRLVAEAAQLWSQGRKLAGI
jgi:hypothetical protein